LIDLKYLIAKMLLAIKCFHSFRNPEIWTIAERVNVKQATKKATKARKQQAISVRLRKKTSPEDLAKASKTITRIARERLLKNRKTFAIQYMLFSLENKSDTKGQVSQKRGGSTTHF